MIRVLQITYSLKAAGIETFVVNLYKNINREEMQFDFASYFPKEKKEFYDNDVFALGGKIHKLGYKERGKVISNIKTRFNLYKCIKENNYEIIHIHGSSGLAVLEALIAKLAGCSKIIIHSHSSNIARTAKMSLIQKWITVLCRPIWKYICSDMLACSVQAAKWLYGRHNEDLVQIISNGIDTTRFYPRKESGQRWRNKHNIGECEFLIGHVASFTVAKNQKYCLEILKEILKMNSRVKMIFVGDGPQRVLIEKRAFDMGLMENCIFYGITNKVEEIMNACDVLILPSFYEGLPVVCIEAQYCGVPMIVSDTVTDEVKISNNIYFKSICDMPQEWAETILSLKGKESSFCVDCNEFDIREVVNKMMIIYRKLEERQYGS